MLEQFNIETTFIFICRWTAIPSTFPAFNKEKHSIGGEITFESLIGGPGAFGVLCADIAFPAIFVFEPNVLPAAASDDALAPLELQKTENKCQSDEYFVFPPRKSCGKYLC